jgi:hypothetical protein
MAQSTYYWTLVLTNYCTGQSQPFSGTVDVYYKTSDSVLFNTQHDQNLVEHSSGILCYPNPFGNHVTFAYQLDKAGQVKIEIYDVRGKIISTPVNENQDNGRHTIHWDAGSLPEGIYFYKFILNDRVQNGSVIKMQ